ncbi:MAG: NfeD family protein [Candidatus Zixiibacteriota bacterium]|jgi:membrane protein implicated in regulation of membrane protease activity
MSSRRTNVDALIGQRAVVLAEVAPLKYGRVKVGGEDWAAVPEGEQVFEVGAIVIVKGYEGVKLIVAGLE